MLYVQLSQLRNININFTNRTQGKMTSNTSYRQHNTTVSVFVGNYLYPSKNKLAINSRKYH